MQSIDIFISLITKKIEFEHRLKYKKSLHIPKYSIYSGEVWIKVCYYPILENNIETEMPKNQG